MNEDDYAINENSATFSRLVPFKGQMKSIGDEYTAPT